MTRPGTPAQPLRVAIVGAGPAGFYAAEKLLKQSGHDVQVDMYDRLPAPFGLVRYGVAPDHEKIRNVIRVFEKTAADPRFRFFGNVDVGLDVTLNDLRCHYHQILFTTGAQTDRRMGIPGEDLARSHPATEFVAWYNGHPDYRDLEFDLSVERAAVVGVGNVAMDVARILCRTREELVTTDIADYAVEALAASRIREVYILGRRGPVQAAFTNPEVSELGELAGADVVTLADEMHLDPLSQAELEASSDKTLARRIEILRSYADRPGSGKPKRLTLRFLVSPTELRGDARGRVTGMRLVRNELFRADDGSLRPRATDRFEDLPVEMVFRSVGYMGVPIAGLPFDEKRGVVPNAQGRVSDPERGKPLRGIYVAGWIKRGPSGVIGTNKPCAYETVEGMMADVEADAVLSPQRPEGDAAEAMVAERQPDFVSWADWRRLCELEETKGREQSRPRVKLTRREEVRAALGRK